MTKGAVRTLVILMIMGSAIGCDRISKNIVRERIADNEQVLINSYLTLTRIENAGAFLSLGHSLPEPLKLFLLTILPMLILTLTFLFLMTRRDLAHITTLGICFIVGGGAGNIYDRLVYGSVTDFLHIDFVIFQTGIFNLADVSIMTGMAMVLVDTYVNGAQLDFRSSKPPIDR